MVNADGTIKQIAKAGIRDRSEERQLASEKKQKKMNSFITNLMKQDREQYERLVDLMRYFNVVDVDLKTVQRLQTFFTIGREEHKSLPMLQFKEATQSVFKNYRQVSEICQKLIECIGVVDAENTVSRLADRAKLGTLIEFMQCFPILVKRVKNSSQRMDYIMDSNSFRANQVTARENEDAEVSARIGQANLDYVKQLMSLIFSRIEDKHKNVTEMFRFMDQRGKG